MSLFFGLLAMFWFVGVVLPCLCLLYDYADKLTDKIASSCRDWSGFLIGPVLLASAGLIVPMFIFIYLANRY